MLRDGKQIHAPDFFSQIISRANQSISAFNNAEAESAMSIESHTSILENKSKMFHTIELSSNRTDTELDEINEVLEWLNSLNHDEEFFNNIDNEIFSSTNSPFPYIKRLISEEREKKLQQKNDKKTSSKKEISFEKAIEKDKENLRIVSYTRSVITLTKDLISIQKEIHEAMKPENILKNESSTSLRFENFKNKLKIELENRRETYKRLKKELKGATVLFNNKVEYHKKLEDELKKLEKYLSLYQSKSSIEIIEKAKKNTFIVSQWNSTKKELNKKIREIDIEINKYKNGEQTSLELSNLIYGNNLELEKLKKNFEDKIESINQEMKVSSFVQMSALQILEKEMISSLNYHRGFESKNTQTDKKIATTNFTRIFMKYSKDKKTCLNKFEKVLRRNNVTYESALDGLKTFGDENKKAFKDALDQIIIELKTLINNYENAFRDKNDFKDRRLKLKWKNEYDVLIGRKQRLSSQIMYRETDILINQSTYNIIEGVYLDILQSFSNNENDAKCQKIQNEIQCLINFNHKASIMAELLSQKLQTSLKNNTKQKMKRSSSMIIQFNQKKLFQTKTESNEHKIETDELKTESNEQKTELNEQKIESFEIKTQSNELKTELNELKTESFEIKTQSNIIKFNPSQNEVMFPTNEINDSVCKKEPLSPRNELHSPRFSAQKKIQNEKSNKKIQNDSLPFSSRSQPDSTTRCSLPSVPPDLFLTTKKRNKHETPKNVIKDNSPHFSERKPKSPRREKSRMEIEEARRISIQSREQTKRTIQDIPKIPFIKNYDPKTINEIDNTYSFSSDLSKKKENNSKITKNKEKNLSNSNEVSQNKNNDEFFCIKNNINVTKSNISDLPFSKRSTTTKQDDMKLNCDQKNSLKIKKSATVNLSAKIFNFSEMTLNNYSFKPLFKQVKKLDRNEILQKVEKIINENETSYDHTQKYKMENCIPASTSCQSIMFSKVNLRKIYNKSSSRKQIIYKVQKLYDD